MPTSTVDTFPVALVVPPFLSLGRPHLGLSLLKAALAKRKIAAEIHYMNFTFAERGGSALPEWIALASPVNQLLGEWVFAHLIGERDDFDLLDQHVDEVQASLVSGHPGTPRNLRRLRDLASEYVNEVAHRLAERAYRVVGLSTSFQQTCPSLAIARRLKQINSHIVICLGGANCESPMGEQLLESFGYIDYIFSGECDIAFPQFIERLLTGRSPLGSLYYDIKSNVRTASRAVIQAHPVRDMNALPLPDMSDYFAAWAASPLRNAVRPALVFESSRGCWWGEKHQCTFCGLNASGIVYRSKSAERTVDELINLAQRYGINDFQVVDNILDNRHIAQGFAALAARGQHLRIFYEIKSNMTFAQLRTIAEAGVSHVQPGVESLDDHVLHIMDKGVSAAQNVAFLRACEELGVQPSWNMLFGFPGEGDEPYARMLELIPYIEHLPAPGSWSPVRIDRFSPFFERSAELGFAHVRPFPAYERVFGVNQEAADKLAYYFCGQGENIVQPSVLGQFIQMVECWQQRYGGSGKTTLTLVDTPSGDMVVDTRGCARQPFTLLDVLDSSVLALCRSPHSEHAIVQTLARNTVPGEPSSNLGLIDKGSKSGMEQLLFHSLSKLQSLGFVLNIGGRLVSVVTESEHLVLDPSLPAPCGSVKGDPRDSHPADSTPDSDTTHDSIIPAAIG